MRKFLRFLSDYREDIKSQWADGNFQRPDAYNYVIEDADAVARAQCYGDLVTMQYDVIKSFYDGMDSAGNSEVESNE